MPKVKVCGITNIEDALLSAKLGADAIGFVFYDGSPRYVCADAVREIVLKLPPFLTKVGVFVNASQDRVREICGQARIDIAQLHGNESPEYCQDLGLPYIKAFHVKDGMLLEEPVRYKHNLAILLDTHVEGAWGGTGQSFDWQIIAKEMKGMRVVLSGGLNALNVNSAIHQCHPYAVDVASGVESRPGKKDPIKLRDFLGECRKRSGWLDG